MKALKFICLSACLLFLVHYGLAQGPSNTSASQVVPVLGLPQIQKIINPENGTTTASPASSTQTSTTPTTTTSTTITPSSSSPVSVSTVQSSSTSSTSQGSTSSKVSQTTENTQSQAPSTSSVAVSSAAPEPVTGAVTSPKSTSTTTLSTTSASPETTQPNTTEPFILAPFLSEVAAGVPPEALRESTTQASKTTVSSTQTTTISTSTTTTTSTTTIPPTTTPEPLVLGPIVTISPGDVRPAKLRSRNGREYFAFKRIPYANPSSNYQRFKEPAPVSSWSDVLNSTEYGPSCIQYNILTESVEGEEDCLSLSVFTPKLPIGRNKKKADRFPVMVFFHQGAFMFGSREDFQEKYIMDEDVVLVTVNYRLGAFGFLNTEGGSDAKGNMGLKDQLLALEFIRDNIHAFNGEANSITIMGESAGAASVHYHLLSERSRGLFHKAISMSGTALSPWAFTISPRRMAKKLGTLLNCPTTDMNELFVCLQGQEARVIAEKTKNLYEWNTDPITPFGPSVEVEQTTTAFMTQTPYTLMKSGRINGGVPWILGVVENVCLLDAWSILVTPQFVEDMNLDWHRIAPVTFMFKETALEPDAVSNQIKAYYFGTNEVGNATATNLTNLYSDRYFNHGIRTSALLHARANEALPVYLYMFSYKGEQSHTQFAGISDILGVSEGDELRFLFNTNRFDDIPAESMDGDISQKFIKLWYSFARSGTPTAVWGGQQWKPITAAQVKGDEALMYYSLNDKCGFVDEPFSARLNFWDNLPLNENDNELPGSIYQRHQGEDYDLFSNFAN